MTAVIALLAQALDNSSPDHIVLKGRELAATDDVNRRLVVSTISRALRDGSAIWSRDDSRLVVSRRHFVLEVSPLELDIRGRRAPICCYGTLERREVDALSREVARALDEFARRIGRTLRPEHHELVVSAFHGLNRDAGCWPVALALFRRVVACLARLFTRHRARLVSVAARTWRFVRSMSARR